jgi:His-Xaa-Ser system protein HxsD
VQIRLDPAAYSVEAAEKAAYRLIDRIAVLVSTDASAIVCEITPEDPALIDAFKREVLDQQLRLSIRTQTEDVRNLILAFAFSRTGLQQ